MYCSPQLANFINAILGEHRADYCYCATLLCGLLCILDCVSTDVDYHGLPTFSMQSLGEHPTDHCHTPLSVAAIIAHHYLYTVQSCYCIGICMQQCSTVVYTIQSNVQCTKVSYIKKLL